MEDWRKQTEIKQHRDGSYSVIYADDGAESRKKHTIVMEGKRKRLWCTRCESQCGATIRLGILLKEGV